MVEAYTVSSQYSLAVGARQQIRRPIASVVVPAHNEAKVVIRCLGGLLDEAEPGEFEVVVIANGCIDQTAELARSFHPDVHVVELAIADKVAALRAGDSATTLFPRVYVDADVSLATSALRALVDALGGEAAVAAAPRMVVAVQGRPAAVRAWYRVWLASAYRSGACVGSGVYGLNAAAHALVSPWPETFADDLHVRLSLGVSRCQVVEGHHFAQQAPYSLRSLVGVRARIVAANRAIGGGEAWPSQRSSLLRQLAQPRRWPDLAVYAGVAAAARVLARRQFVRTRWVRDDTARKAAAPQVTAPQVTATEVA